MRPPQQLRGQTYDPIPENQLKNEQSERAQKENLPGMIVSIVVAVVALVCVGVTVTVVLKQKKK